MDGDTLAAGSVACIRNVANPVSVARLVMERSDHVMLVGDGAHEFATEQGVPFVPDTALVMPAAEAEWEAYQRFSSARDGLFNVAPPASQGCDTVGAVALDATGAVAAATSTGGITNKRDGRVGDSPILGSGPVNPGI